jgi:branched-chain amino acid transport system substrate-binding protein
MVASSAAAQKKYDPGASDTEIKIGNIMPYSGPASAYGVIGKAQAAYFKKINEEGGINGRKINFITLDDAYSPPKTVEMVRRLVEQDEVLLVFNPLGTPSNTAAHRPHSLTALHESAVGTLAPCGPMTAHVRC